MVLLKSFLAGIAAVVAYLGVVVLTLWFVPLWWSEWRARSVGSGGYGFVLMPGRVFLLLLLGLAVFIGAFWWEWRRASGR